MPVVYKTVAYYFENRCLLVYPFNYFFFFFFFFVCLFVFVVVISSFSFLPSPSLATREVHVPFVEMYFLKECSQITLIDGGAG